MLATCGGWGGGQGFWKLHLRAVELGVGENGDERDWRVELVGEVVVPAAGLDFRHEIR